MGKILLKCVLNLKIILGEIQCFNLCYSTPTHYLFMEIWHLFVFISHLVAETVGSHVAS